MELTYKKVLLIFLITLAMARGQLSAKTVNDNTLPTNPNIKHGRADFDKRGNTLNIIQHSNKLITNWSSFDIGKNAVVNFKQKNSNSVALNRVLDGQKTQIAGKLNANGQVFLVNQAGVLISKGASIDVGALTISTNDIKDENFIAGDYRFEKSKRIGKAQIYNLGDITVAKNSYIALISHDITNEGKLTALNGDVKIIEGNKDVTISFDEKGLVNFKIGEEKLKKIHKENAMMRVESGLALFDKRAVDDILYSVVNNEVKEANYLVKKKERTFLLSSKNQDFNQKILSNGMPAKSLR